MNIKDITITSLETISAFSIPDGAYLFTMDELQKTDISQTQETSDITGKAGRKLSTLKKSKAVEISGTNGFISGGLLELQTGNNFENKTTTVMWTDYLTVNASNKATTTYKAIGTAGAEIAELYVKKTDGSADVTLTQADSVSAGKFTYDPSTKELAFNTDVASGTEIVAIYERNITANVLTNQSDKFSGKATLYIDAMGEDKCGNIYRVQFYIPKADFSGEFGFSLGEDQAVHEFKAEALAGACGAGGALWTYTVFGADTVDAPSLSSIAVTTPPTKTSYTAGEAFNATGMVVTATYSDGSTAAVTGYTFAPTGALATTDTTVTITYNKDGIVKTTTQAITVTAG